MEKQILNQTEAAEILGIHRRTLHNWKKISYGPKFTRVPSGREVTTRDNVNAFLAELSK